MASIIEIITLQNPDVNFWAWITISSIMYIYVGFMWEEISNNSMDGEELLLLVMIPIWPAIVMLFLLFTIISFPFFLGKFIRNHSVCRSPKT